MPRSNGACQTENPSVSYYFVETSEGKNYGKRSSGHSCSKTVPVEWQSKANSD